jgi:hypothetical protein
MNPHDEISAEEIQASLDALSLPSPTQLTVNITRKLYKQGTNLILLEPDIAEAFPDSKSVNDSLRALASIIQVRSKALAAI